MLYVQKYEMIFFSKLSQCNKEVEKATLSLPTTNEKRVRYRCNWAKDKDLIV